MSVIPPLLDEMGDKLEAVQVGELLARMGSALVSGALLASRPSGSPG